MKFCGECGAKLELVCPKCRFSNPNQFKFCGECGQELTRSSEPVAKELSFDDKIGKIQRYLPRGLAEKVLSQRDKIEGERKQVTVMFCDMVGFTSIVERATEEEAYEMMDLVYEILIQQVHRYEGTVNEMTGDGIMAMFGAPIALENAPQRALQAALSVQRELTRFSNRKGHEGSPVAIRMRIGIHTGPVVVGTLGNDLRVEFKAVGDTVNVAKRMEEVAESGTICVTHDTFKLTQGYFRFERLGKRNLKGKSGTFDVYQVLAPSTSSTRFEVSAERGLTPFTGREREIELLLDGFERAKSGRGQAFSIIAEAGVGKTRLLHEFSKRVTSEDMVFRHAKCLSYGHGETYHPIIAVTRANFDIQDRDSDTTIRQKISDGLKAIRVDEHATLPYLLSLLSVKEAGTGQDVDLEEGRYHLMESLKRIALRGAEVQPIIIAIEDLHWIDKGSEEAIQSLFESIAGARIMLILTYRPEYVNTWGARTYHNQITLNRLSNRESLLMTSHILHSTDLGSELEELVLEKTEGVPFFIEELLRSLTELQIIEEEKGKHDLTKGAKELTIPSTIQDVIMARVDPLPDGTKSVLQVGSVFGREFSYELIRQVTGLPEQALISHLSALRDLELVYEHGVFPDSRFSFKHAYTRDVVYDSILTRRRREIHADIAKGIEKHHASRLAEQYEALAHHCSESDNHQKASRYFTLSGTKAYDNYAMEGAYNAYSEALRSADRLVDGEEKRRTRTEIGSLMFGSMRVLGFPEGSLEIMQEREKHLTALGDKRNLAICYRDISAFHSYKGNPGEAGRYALPRFSDAMERQDVELIAPLTIAICESYNVSGRYKDIVTLVPDVLTLLEKNGVEAQFFGDIFNPYTFICSICGCSMAHIGQFDEGRVYFEKALQNAIKIRHSVSQGVVGLYRAFYYLLMSDGEATIEQSQKAIQIFAKPKFHLGLGMAWVASGYGHFLLGTHQTALDHIQEGLAIQEEKPVSWGLGKYPLFTSYICHDMGDYLRARTHAEEALQLSRRNGERFYEGNSLIVLGRVLSKADLAEADRSEKHIMDGISILEGLGLQPTVCQGRFFLGELYAAMGRREDARDPLDKALAMADSMGMHYWHDRIQKALDAL